MNMKMNRYMKNCKHMKSNQSIKYHGSFYLKGFHAPKEIAG